ncbi:AmmeMemoRadiSam system radical SAM enzyme [Candidatus Dependentiae bacterium]|nr:AmmeMemoRadiSam system radical SAM enzyme [Candidatus Dependentiae bacterium]
MKKFFPYFIFIIVILFLIYQITENRNAEKYSEYNTISANKNTESNIEFRKSLSYEKTGITEVVFNPGNDSIKITKALVNAKGLALKEAKYYEKLEAGRILCLLCPKECVIEEGEQGDCRARANIDGKLYSLVFGRPVTMALDPIEKKPFFHFFPKSSTFSIATAGCNLHCINCQNWNISQLNPFDMRAITAVEPEQIVEYAKKSKSDIISYTYNEPVIYYEYVLETAKIAKKQGLKNAIVSAGYINEEPLRELCKYIDAATIDVKGMSENFYRSFTTAKLKPVLESLKILKQENIWLEVSYLIITGANDSDNEIKKFVSWIKVNLGEDVPVHFLRFFPNYKLKNKPPTPEHTMIKAFNIAKSEGLKFVYIGNLDSDKTNTYCPGCGKLIAERKGYNIKSLKISNSGTCEFCGYKINGKFR